MTTLRVLGSAAGGGFPQWNCNCFNCDGLRRGVIAASARTPSSIALSEDGVHWLLVNASPDILAQIRATPALQPARAARDTRIVALLPVDPPTDPAAALLTRPPPALHPARAARDPGIVAVLLVNAQIDHAPGLLMLREHRSALPVYATPAVLQDLAEGFPLTRILSHYCRLQAHPLALDASPFCVPPLTGLRLHAIALDSKPPPYSPHRAAPQRGANIG